MLHTILNTYMVNLANFTWDVYFAFIIFNKVSVFGFKKKKKNKCDWARYIFECLSMFAFKGVTKSSNDLQENVGYGFMIVHLLNLKRVTLSEVLKSTCRHIYSKP